jgi:hypothetical protein
MRLACFVVLLTDTISFPAFSHVAPGPAPDTTTSQATTTSVVTSEQREAVREYAAREHPPQHRPTAAGLLKIGDSIQSFPFKPLPPEFGVNYHYIALDNGIFLAEPGSGRIVEIIR